MKLENATALVTGANRGVGRFYVSALLERGAAKVYATARNADTLDDIVALDAKRVVPLELDVTSDTAIANAKARAGDLTVLINNAGSLHFGGALEVAKADMEHDMSVNNDGLREMTRAFAPVIEANGGGVVVNMLSLLSFLSAPGFSGYNASKAAAWSTSMSLRAYLRPMGVGVVNAFPAGIDTDMLAGVEADKDAPADVVRDVLDAVEKGEEDVYPASAASVFGAWREDQKAVEEMFATMM